MIKKRLFVLIAAASILTACGSNENKDVAMVTPAATPSSEERGDGPVTPVPTDAASPSPTPYQKPEDGRDEYWEDTGFMCQLPYFPAGVFTSYSATDYFDYTFYSGVSEAEAESYIELLKNAGYKGDYTKTDAQILYVGTDGEFDCDFRYEMKTGEVRLAAGLSIEETD